MEPLAADKKVRNVSFVSSTIPDVAVSSAVVAVCAVPTDRAGLNDLGWHITDFLAFKSLLCPSPDSPDRTQTWLALCDVPDLIQKHPEQYLHGKERRVVDGAAEKIQQIPSTGDLKDAFLAAIREKAAMAVKDRDQITIIACGLTSLEQDIYLGGQASADHLCTMAEICAATGEKARALLITPALFSAGWQMNLLFNHPFAGGALADRNTFLMRQLGGLFAVDATYAVFGWQSPVLDLSGVSPEEQTGDCPGPAILTLQQEGFHHRIENKVEAILAGRCNSNHNDHSFSFDVADDDWELLLRPRRGQSLAAAGQKWSALPSKGAIAVHQGQGSFAFMGNAFGGNRDSQLAHLEHLMQESFLAWPAHWRGFIGKGVKKEFRAFLDGTRNDVLKCHELFNVLEHRATTSILGDTIVRYFGLPQPQGLRCRDYDRKKGPFQSKEAAVLGKKVLSQMSGILPFPKLPGGVHRNTHTKYQRRLEEVSLYLADSLILHFQAEPEGFAGRETVRRIVGCKYRPRIHVSAPY
ncbi:hypothetical protein F4780DRAFT_745400 [Xylariomycetidae sp. FL0641]|nr:hypothetical protein F4780DRAFT_745400 [Xylariomycetidae sp. FL0641]